MVYSALNLTSYSSFTALVNSFANALYDVFALCLIIHLYKLYVQYVYINALLASTLSTSV